MKEESAAIIRIGLRILSSSSSVDSLEVAHDEHMTSVMTHNDLVIECAYDIYCVD